MIVLERFEIGDMAETLVEVKPVYIKGIRGEIVSLGSINAFWKTKDPKTGNWEVWADTRKNPFQIFEGDDAEVNTFMDALNDVFKPYDLTKLEDRERLKGDA